MVRAWNLLEMEVPVLDGVLYVEHNQVVPGRLQQALRRASKPDHLLTTHRSIKILLSKCIVENGLTVSGYLLILCRAD